MDRELDHDDRDHGVRELDALRLQDGYLLCVLGVVCRVCLRVCVLGMRVVCRVCLRVCVLGMRVCVLGMRVVCRVCWLVQRRRIYRLALPKSGLYAHTMP